MKNVTVSYVADERKSSSKGIPVRIRVYMDRENIYYMNTGFYVLDKNEFNFGRFTKSKMNYQSINMKLNNWESEIIKYALMNEVPFKLLKEKVTEIVSGKEKQKYFVDFLDDFVKMKSKENTVNVYIATRNKIENFDKTASFATINKEWLFRFEKWMKESGLSTNTRSIHLRNIRSIFNNAIDNEYTMNYPFRKFSIAKEETRKRSLTITQLRELRTIECETCQEQYRDMFMLMFYLIGINPIDLFTGARIAGERIEYKRAKTGKLYSIKLEPEAMEIINRYKGDGDSLLNVIKGIDYHTYCYGMNRALKKIGKFERKGRGGKK